MPGTGSPACDEAEPAVDAGESADAAEEPGADEDPDADADAGEESGSGEEARFGEEARTRYVSPWAWNVERSGAGNGRPAQVAPGAGNVPATMKRSTALFTQGFPPA